MDSFPEEIIFNAPGQNPEGIEYNPETISYFLSAIIKNPYTISVNLDGSVKTFSNDKNGVSMASFGLQIDLQNTPL